MAVIQFSSVDQHAVRRLASAAAPAFLALYLVSNLLVRSFSDIWLFIGWTSLCIGFILGGTSKGPRFIFLALIGLLIFHVLAIPGSLIWGSGNWELTAGVVLWMAPAMFLYLANNVDRVFVWLLPAFLLHATFIIIDGLTHWNLVGDILVKEGQNTGFANNPNLAAGFLLIGIIYLIQHPRGPWLKPVLQAALLFTGSRWGIAVAAVLLVAMVVTRTISWKPLVIAGASIVGAVMLIGSLGVGGEGYKLAGYGSFTAIANTVPEDIGVRLAIPHLPTFLPSGVAEHPGLHNVPLRIAVENGLIAAGIWVLITGWALTKRKFHYNRNNQWPQKEFRDEHPSIDQNVHCWLLFRRRPKFVNSGGQERGNEQWNDNVGDQPNGAVLRPVESKDVNKVWHRRLLLPFRWLATTTLSLSHDTVPRSQTEPKYECAEQPQNNVHRWLLLTLVLLSVLDYYTWMGHLGGFWWLLIGLLLKR